MKRKLSMLFAAVALATVALVGCKGPTEEEYKQWAEENGYVVAPTEDDYKDWAEENGYVIAPAALPAARLETETDYSYASSKIQISPKDENEDGVWDNGVIRLLDVLGRDDTIYIDAREFASYAKGHIVGFESLPSNQIITGSGEQLFSVSGDTVTPRYEESVTLMKKLLPQPEGKNMILMCQSGARIVSLMKVLKYCGYDMTRIFNVGGFGQVDKAVYPVTAGNVTVTESYSFTAAGLTPYTPAA